MKRYWCVYSYSIVLNPILCQVYEYQQRHGLAAIFLNDVLELL